MVFRSCNIVNNQLNLNELVHVGTAIRENQLVRENDILICARNGSKALVGKCALIPKLYEPASFGAFMAIYRTKFFEYILFYLRSDLFRNIFNKGNSTAINQLTQDMLGLYVRPIFVVPIIDKLHQTQFSGSSKDNLRKILSSKKPAICSTAGLSILLL